MKNFIALIFIFILGMQMAFAETLPPKGYYDVKPEDYPVLFEYMNNYAKQLFEEFNPNKFWLYGFGTVEFYQIDNDGFIHDLSKPENFYDRELIRIVKRLPPKPLPKQLEINKIKIWLVLIRNKQDKFKIDYNPINECIEITIYKDHQRKSWFKKKKK